jgi:RNA 3'-terminal phosphate cyclase (ATP)
MVEQANTVEVDGSMLEGGGQLFRMSVALAYIFNRKLHITKIRANRAKGGGLGNQHLTGLQSVVKMLPGCEVSGNKKGSTEVVFDPCAKKIKQESFVADCGSPGAIGLILQMLTPCLMFNSAPSCDLLIKGGSMVGMSPNTDCLANVLLPVLRRMGAEISLEVPFDGYFPDVIGEAATKIKALSKPLQSIELVDRGEFQHVDLYVNYSAGEMQDYFESTYLPQLELLMGDIKFEIHARSGTTNRQKFRAKTLSITAVLRFEKPSMLSAT